jgi:hypothetical protein
MTTWPIRTLANRVFVTASLAVMNRMLQIRVLHDVTELWDLIHTSLVRLAIRVFDTRIPMLRLDLLHHLHTMAVMADLVLVRA